MARSRSSDPAELVEAARGGDRAALARLLSVVETGGPPARDVAAVVHPLGGAATTVGITGAPGAGKSTLTAALVARMRADDQAVAVLAVDPSSPFTGGAILGDRVRMGEHALDEGVFIRSMATRGHLGGLALAVPEAVRVLDAVGWPWVLLETVGVGQVEVEVAGEADTTVVVVNPGWGDAVQANKAGLMEIADVFVINKADRPGAAETRRDLEAMQRLSSGARGRNGPGDPGSGPTGPGDTGAGPGAGAEPWVPPIVEAVATSGEGVDELWAAVRSHGAWAARSGERARRREQRLDAELRRILMARLLERATGMGEDDAFTRLRGEVAARRLDPWAATDRLLDHP